MGKRFNEYIERKISTGTLYQHTLAGNDICGNCIYRRPWQNLCSKFNKPIQKIGQRNRGFHHLPCTECLNYKIQKCDIQYYVNVYKKRNPYKVVNVDLDKLLLIAKDINVPSKKDGE